jgi:hypothetical protein
MRFEKVKYNGEKVELIWHTTDEDGTRTQHTLTSREKPLGPFRAAMAAFAPLVMALLEWPVGYEENLHVTGISLNTEDEKKGGARGIVVSGRKDVAGARAPYFFNTPHLREAPPESAEGTAGLYDKRWALAIEEVEKQATLYQKGEREQGELELESVENEEELEAAGVDE